MTPLLAVDGLSVRYAGAHGFVTVVDNVGFTTGRERLGLVGQSGSGKSTVGRALLGLLPPHAEVAASRLEFDGKDLRSASRGEWRGLRGRRIGLVLQDPKFSLDPVMSLGAQVAEAFVATRALGRRAAHAAAIDMLAAVGFEEPARVARLYPHQVSGGMGQRAMIAQALAGEPDLLIADEPTSALDAASRHAIAALLDRLAAERRMGLILISHDLDLVAGLCDRVLVMRRGRIVERCAAADLARSDEPYTRALLAARLPPLIA
jgi:peptide/nickel transport system ATP-binding protein